MRVAIIDMIWQNNIIYNAALINQIIWLTILEGGSFVSEILNSSRIVSCCVTLSSKSKNKHTITEGIMLHLTRFHFSLRLNKIYEETAHCVSVEMLSRTCFHKYMSIHFMDRCFSSSTKRLHSMEFCRKTWHIHLTFIWDDLPLGTLSCKISKRYRLV